MAKKICYMFWSQSGLLNNSIYFHHLETLIANLNTFCSIVIQYICVSFRYFQMRLIHAISNKFKCFFKDGSDLTYSELLETMSLIQNGSISFSVFLKKQRSLLFYCCVFTSSYHRHKCQPSANHPSSTAHLSKFSANPTNNLPPSNQSSNISD